MNQRVKLRIDDQKKISQSTAIENYPQALHENMVADRWRTCAEKSIEPVWRQHRSVLPREDLAAVNGMAMKWRCSAAYEHRVKPISARQNWCAVGIVTKSAGIKIAATKGGGLREILCAEWLLRLV